MTRIFYNLAISLFGFSFFLYSLFNRKAKLRRKGLGGPKAPLYHNLILVHCASAGEFEQAYPIIKHLQKNLSNHNIAISFFSASGMEWLEKKNIDLPHFYLPLDRPKKMKEFVTQLNPKLVLVVKNEFWFNFFQATLEHKSLLILIATAFKEDHFALKYNYFSNILNKAKHIFTLDQKSYDIARSKLTNLSLGGDPRIDRIIDVSKTNRLPIKLDLNTDKKRIIYASVHQEDIQLINSTITDDRWQHIIVPHEVSKGEIDFFKQKLHVKPHLLSEIDRWNGEVLMVDSIGVLSSLYNICDYSYIGGGFGEGIHNLLESAVFGNIIFVGPKNDHFPEARILKENRAILEIKNTDNIGQFISSLSETDIIHMKNEMIQFFKNHNGASEKIATKIKEYLCD